MSFKTRYGINTDLMYDDIPGQLIGLRLFSSPGTVDFEWDENGIIFEPNGSISSQNDRILINIQYPHQAKMNGKLYPHIHWEQVSSNDVIFTMQYRIQSNGVSKETTWTTMTASAVNDSIFTYTSGTLNQITKFKNGSDYFIDMSGKSISSTLQFRLTRTDATAGNVIGTFFDLHYEIDSYGSRLEYIK